MGDSKVLWGLVLCLCVALPCVNAEADWGTQVIPLHPGWNAIHLQIQPEDNTCEEVFAGLPVKSAWAWNPRFASAQYVRDPSELRPELPEWLTYFPEGGPTGFLSDLRALHGGKAYLVELGGEETVNLVISGNRQYETTKWMKDSFNLMGFPVDPAAKPTVKQFFAPSPAHDGRPVYQLSRAGKWEEITEPAKTRLNAGEAYWVYCDGESEYSGPLGVSLDFGDELSYGAVASERVLYLKNRSNEMRTVRLNLRPSSRPSERPEEDDLLPLAGEVPLAYYNLRPEDVNQKILSWAPVDENTTFLLDPLSEQQVTLVVRRSEMPNPETRQAMFESVLEVRDGAGSYYEVPVSARKALNDAGLWVGNVSVNRVSEAGNPEDWETPTRTATEFTFRVIVHRDASGTSRLLQKVTFLEIQPVYGENPEDPTGPEILLEPSRTVLLTDDTAAAEQASAATNDDGELMGRRISAPAFAFADSIDMAEDQWSDPDRGSGMRLTCEIPMDYKDPLNPFVHRYHPDHDNMDERYEAELSEGKESFSFVRTITLEFEDEDPDGVTYPEWGGTVQGGTYRETIEGIHKKAIQVQGTFRLQLVSLVDRLNDGA